MSGPVPRPPVRPLPSVTQRAVLRSAVLTDGWVHARPHTIAALRTLGWVAGPERESTGGRVSARITPAGAEGSAKDVPGMAKDWHQSRRPAARPAVTPAALPEPGAAA